MIKVYRLYWRVDHICMIETEWCNKIEWFDEKPRERMTGWIDKGWWRITNNRGRNPYASHLYLDKASNMIDIIKYIKKETKYPEELEGYIKRAKSILRQEKIERILGC